LVKKVKLYSKSILAISKGWFTVERFYWPTKKLVKFVLAVSKLVASNQSNKLSQNMVRKLNVLVISPSKFGTNW
jgi:hypothetical protein